MENIQKEQIKDRLEVYVNRYESQNKASNSLKGVSSATISQVLNGNWGKINVNMWRNIDAQIGYNLNVWNSVATKDYNTLYDLLKDAQIYSNVFAVTGNAGSGKSHISKLYQENNQRAYLLQCSEYWNKKYFLGQLLQSMGRDYSGLTVSEMMDEVVRVLKRQKNPVIILDEADKLTDQVLYFFITIYNQLEDHCGIVLLATDHLEKRIRKGLKLNKKGYKEIYSRIGRKFVELRGVGSIDITNVCKANGVTKQSDIKKIIEDSDYDLRRVKRKIHAVKMKNSCVKKQ